MLRLERRAFNFSKRSKTASSSFVIGRFPLRGCNKRWEFYLIILRLSFLDER